MVEGVILAGGLSSRMGRDKAMLTYKGHTLIDHMQNILAQMDLSSISVSGETGTPDCLPQRGPVGGLCTMITANPHTDGWLFVPIDMPLLQPILLQRLLHVEHAEAVFFDSTPLPLLVRNTPTVKDHIHQALDALHKGRDFSLRGFLESLNVKTLSTTKTEQSQLANINTPEEWQQLMEVTHVSAS